MKLQKSQIALIALGIPNAAYGFGSEIIGPYTIVEAPIMATLTSGGGASFNWLNVVNAPVSINEAFTGFSIIADGYANANAGTTIVVTFASGALHNGPAYDLVLFDANDDLNVYLIATSHDGFSQQIVVTSFGDTGVDRSYFYGGTGPSTFDVTAAEIDLSSLGVPDGEFVDQVRLFAEGPSNDPLGIGVVQTTGPPVPTVSQWGLITLMLLLTAAGAVVIAVQPRRDL